MYRDRPLTLNELKTAITALIRNILQADLQKVFANKIKRAQTCIDSRGHHFQHLFLNAQRLSERTVFVCLWKEVNQPNLTSTGTSGGSI
jgi:CDP-diacylglycerol pyrophosphatase